jgi:3-oxoacyl-[acyl-carrier protein] reductase
MDFGLKGRVALVAASSSGLGKASALALAREGASVVVNGRKSETLEPVAAEIRSATRGDVLAVTGDVTREDDVRQMIAETVRKFGRLDVLITNAGGPPPGFFDDFTADHYRQAVELNLLSTINLCREAVPHMRERKWGRIVAITSIAAKQPVQNLILSNTARAGVLGFLKSLADQVGGAGITVNTVCPGYHLTERLKSLAGAMAQREGVSVEDIYSRWAATAPVNRIGEPAEFAAMIAFLCSEQASYVTGTAIQVDGGAYRALY